VVAVQRLAATVVAGLRRTVVAQQATLEPPAHGPGLVVLDRQGQIESLTRPPATGWTTSGMTRRSCRPWRLSPCRRPGPGPVPHPTGQWLILHGARLDGDPQGRVSVIIEPPRPDELAPLLVAAYGLSDREQAVAALVLRGRSTRQIARALSISPYTVQEHLTAVFDKVGVRSRGELVGQVFFRHCLPQIPD
jgi:DNA-binding CsgD family transcriptional regulator